MSMSFNSITTFSGICCKSLQPPSLAGGVFHKALGKDEEFHGMVASLSAGDPLAFHGLRDWVEENPHHPLAQKHGQDISDFHKMDFLHDDKYTPPKADPPTGWKFHFGDTPDDRQIARGRSIARHIIGDNNHQRGEPVIDNTLSNHKQNYQGLYTGNAHIMGHVVARVPDNMKPEQIDGVRGWYADGPEELDPLATYHLGRYREAQGFGHGTSQKTLNCLHKGSIYSGKRNETKSDRLSDLNREREHLAQAHQDNRIRQWTQIGVHGGVVEERDKLRAASRQADKDRAVLGNKGLEERNALVQAGVAGDDLALEALSDWYKENPHELERCRAEARRLSTEHADKIYNLPEGHPDREAHSRDYLTKIDHVWGLLPKVGDEETGQKNKSGILNANYKALFPDINGPEGHFEQAYDDVVRESHMDRNPEGRDERIAGRRQRLLDVRDQQRQYRKENPHPSETPDSVTPWATSLKRRYQMNVHRMYPGGRGPTVAGEGPADADISPEEANVVYDAVGEFRKRGVHPEGLSENQQAMYKRSLNAERVYAEMAGHHEALKKGRGRGKVREILRNLGDSKRTAEQAPEGESKSMVVPISSKAMGPQDETNPNDLRNALDRKRRRLNRRQGRIDDAEAEHSEMMEFWPGTVEALANEELLDRAQQVTDNRREILDRNYRAMEQRFAEQEAQRDTKAMSSVQAGRGAELIPPPEQRLHRRQRSYFQNYPVKGIQEESHELTRYAYHDPSPVTWGALQDHMLDNPHLYKPNTLPRLHNAVYNRVMKEAFADDRSEGAKDREERRYQQLRATMSSEQRMNRELGRSEGHKMTLFRPAQHREVDQGSKTEFSQRSIDCKYSMPLSRNDADLHSDSRMSDYITAISGFTEHPQGDQPEFGSHPPPEQFTDSQKRAYADVVRTARGASELHNHETRLSQEFNAPKSSNVQIKGLETSDDHGRAAQERHDDSMRMARGIFALEGYHSDRMADAPDMESADSHYAHGRGLAEAFEQMVEPEWHSVRDLEEEQRRLRNQGKALQPPSLVGGVFGKANRPFKGKSPQVLINDSLAADRQMESRSDKVRHRGRIKQRQIDEEEYRQTGGNERDDSTDTLDDLDHYPQ